MPPAAVRLAAKAPAAETAEGVGGCTTGEGERGETRDGVKVPSSKGADEAREEVAGGSAACATEDSTSREGLEQDAEGAAVQGVASPAAARGESSAALGGEASQEELVAIVGGAASEGAASRGDASREDEVGGAAAEGAASPAATTGDSSVLSGDEERAKSELQGTREEGSNSMAICGCR